MGGKEEGREEKGRSIVSGRTGDGGGDGEGWRKIC